MNYREMKPIPALQPYIKCIWTLSSNAMPAEPERVFPDGCMELIFNLKTPLVRISGNTNERQPKTFIFGQLTGALHLLPTANYSVVAVRFTPFGLSAFTNIPSLQFKGTEVTIENLWGEEGKELEEKVNTLTTANAVAAIQQFFITRLKKHLTPHTLQPIGAIANTIMAENGAHTVQYWAHHANLSQRQFNRRFKNIVGITPKEYIKVVRFNKVLRHFNTDSPDSMAMLAQQFGYYDQAHFIKDFREFTGITPGSFVHDSKTLIPF
jgi:AraC-like DNA-binding protein